MSEVFTELATNATAALAWALAPDHADEDAVNAWIPTAALIRADMQERGWDVRRTHRPEDGAMRATVLAHGIAYARSVEGAPEPRDAADAERAVARLWSAGWDIASGAAD